MNTGLENIISNINSNNTKVLNKNKIITNINDSISNRNIMSSKKITNSLNNTLKKR